MAEYRIRNIEKDAEGETHSFETDRDAQDWWSHYALDHPGVRARELVLERAEGEGRWVFVASHEQDGKDR